jgi:hypothetical protein
MRTGEPKFRRRSSIVGRMSSPDNQEASKKLIERIEAKRKETSGSDRSQCKRNGGKSDGTSTKRDS